MKRRSDWPEILSREIKEADRRVFEFGQHDCCISAARIIKAYTGVDLMKGLRGYKSHAAAMKTLQTKGRGSLTKTMDAVMAAHGCAKVKAAFCRRGDAVIAVLDTDYGRERVIGICIGAQAAFAAEGLLRISMANVIRGWRIG